MIRISRFVTALTLFASLAIVQYTFGRELLVADRVSNRILAFDYENPSSFRVLVDPQNPLTPSPLSIPAAMTIGPGGDLFVASQGNGKVLRYNIATGAYLSEFASSSTVPELAFGPAGLHYDSTGNRMFVSVLGDPETFEFPGGSTTKILDDSGVSIGTVNGGALDHKGGRSGLAMDSSGNLYASSFNIDGFSATGGETGAVVKYSGAGFATFQNVIAGNVTYLDNFDMMGNLVAPIIAGMNGLAIDAGNSLYAASLFGQMVVKMDTDGNVQGILAAPFNPMNALSNANTPTAFPSGITIDPLTGDVLVTTLGDYNTSDGVYGSLLINGNVQRFSSTGQYLGLFIDPSVYLSGYDLQMGIYPSFTSSLISPVPEPSALILAAIGMAGVVWYARQRRRIVTG